MDTRTTTSAVRLEDRPQGSVDTTERAAVTVAVPVTRTPAATRSIRRPTRRHWVLLVILASVLVVVFAATIAARTPSAPPAQLIDGGGAPVLVTGSNTVARAHGRHPHLPAGHVVSRGSHASIAHALGWFGGRAST
jgi:hypothetical protein